MVPALHRQLFRRILSSPVTSARPVCSPDRNSRYQGHTLENHIGNAWKFTRRKEPARIEFGQEISGNRAAYFVRDNGAGFDMDYADKLFTTFYRLHQAGEFEGTGIGLSIAQRVIHLHGGRLWGQAVPDEGATFYFTLKPAAPGQK